MAGYKHIGELIKSLRVRHGLSQTQLANKIGTSNSEVCRIEKGSRKPSKKTLLLISFYFKIEVDELLTLSGDNAQLELSIPTNNDIIKDKEHQDFMLLKKSLVKKSKEISRLLCEVEEIASKMSKSI